MSPRTYHVVKWHIEAAITDREDTSLLIVSFPECDDFNALEFTLGDASVFADVVKDHLAGRHNAPGVKLDGGVSVWIEHRSSGIRLVADYGVGGKQIADLSQANAEAFISELEAKHDAAHSELDAKLIKGVGFIDPHAPDNKPLSFD